jgi:hypothetical protein
MFRSYDKRTSHLPFPISLSQSLILFPSNQLPVLLRASVPQSCIRTLRMRRCRVLHTAICRTGFLLAFLLATNYGSNLTRTWGVNDTETDMNQSRLHRNHHAEWATSTSASEVTGDEPGTRQNIKVPYPPYLALTHCIQQFILRVLRESYHLHLLLRSEVQRFLTPWFLTQLHEQIHERKASIKKLITELAHQPRDGIWSSSVQKSWSTLS